MQGATVFPEPVHVEVRPEDSGTLEAWPNLADETSRVEEKQPEDSAAALSAVGGKIPVPSHQRTFSRRQSSATTEVRHRRSDGVASTATVQFRP